MTRKLKRGGYSYSPSPEAIREFQKLTPENRIYWMEAMSRFFYYAMPPKSKLIAEQLRAGKRIDQIKA